MKLLQYFSFLFCTLIYIKSFAQQTPSIKFTHLTTKDGLCSPKISKIYQDKTGYLWFCTYDGLQRYDGKNFKIFYSDPGKKNTLASDNITDIKEDKFGRYWIGLGNNGGLCIYDPSTETYISLNSKMDSLLDDNILDIIFTNNGNTALVSSMHGLYKFDVTTLKFKRFLTADGLQNNFTEQKLYVSNNFFLISTRGGLQLYNEAKDSFYTKDNAPVLKHLLAFSKGAEVRDLLQDKKGKIWFSYWLPGFYCYDPEKNIVKEIILDSSDNKKNLDKVVTSIIEDENENLYIGTQQAGIYYFNTHNNKVEHHYVNDASNPSSLISSAVSFLFFDNQKTLWIGTDAGISKYNKASNRFNYPLLHQQTENFMPGALLQSRDGHIWVGTYSGKGLFEFDTNFKQLHQYKIFEGSDNFKENGIVTLNQTGKGDIMVCRQDGFSLINPSTGKQNDFTNMPDLSHSSTLYAYEDEYRNIWIGCTRSKLICLDSAYRHITVFPTNDWTYIIKIKDKKILLDFHTTQYKLYCFDMLTKEIHQEPYYFFKKRDSLFVQQVQNNFTDIKFYGDDVYAVTRNGLYILNNCTGAVQHYTRADGLPSNEIRAIQKDANGNIWLPASMGLSVFNPVTKKFRNFGEEEGLKNLEFEYVTITQLINQMMIAGDMNNLVTFYPDSLLALSIPPLPVIADMYIGNKEAAVSANGKYNVSYKTNSIRIDYASLDFINSKKIKYAYKLEGFDKDWNYVGNATTATYTNLDGGNYTFKVKAFNEQDKWNETVTNLQFSVSSPFYKQAWFFVLIAGIIIATLYAFYRTRIQRILEVERLRNSISRDLHDEIGSTLSSISMLSTSAEFSLQNKQTKPAEMLVHRISSSSQRILEVMDDIIWTINPKNDSLKNMMTRIRELMNDIADTQGIKFNMQIDPSLEKLNLPMKLKRNFYLIFKEAVANVGNHSECKIADISVQKNYQSILLKIKDDGRGFDAEKKFNGNGLKNMQQRSAEIKSILNIVSQINKGTVLTLTIPIP